ncbi:MAG: MinD/ParA family protein, partial [Frankia sp.]|nr:MinD/ParA family protein [Frankia sp.]
GMPGAAGFPAAPAGAEPPAGNRPPAPPRQRRSPSPMPGDFVDDLGTRRGQVPPGYGPPPGPDETRRARGDAGPPPPPPGPPPAPPAPQRRQTPRPPDPGRRPLGASPSGRTGTGNPPSAALQADALLPPAPETAARGWRKVVYQMSGGAVNPGPSPEEARENRLLAHIRAPLNDCHRIAVMSLKGGVGKTTTTIGLGATLADLRDDRVVAIDANPDRGTLATKVHRQSPYTVRELLEDAPRLYRYVDIRRYLSQSDSRLDVLASAHDPEISEAFADSDYRTVDNLLQRHYSILLTDCGTGMLHSAMHGVLELVDTLVIVTSSSADGGTSASATLDWLDAHGYADRARDAIAVISMLSQGNSGVDVDALEAHFAARTRRVIRVPYDPHLAAGGRISLSELKRETRRAYRELAAAVAERFSEAAPAERQLFS